jgi:hypothetical protein
LIKEFLQNRDIHAKFYGILSIRWNLLVGTHKRWHTNTDMTA